MLPAAERLRRELGLYPPSLPVVVEAGRLARLPGELARLVNELISTGDLSVGVELEGRRARYLVDASRVEPCGGTICVHVRMGFWYEAEEVAADLRDAGLEARPCSDCGKPTVIVRLEPDHPVTLSPTGRGEAYEG